MLTEDVEVPVGWSGQALLERAAPPRAALVVRAARVADMQQVEPLINGFAARELMLPKTIEQLSRLFREFVVAEAPDGRILGCAALRVYTPQLAELGSLAVHADAHGTGIGRKLVERIEEEARALGIGTVFALTLQDVFFQKLGYHTVSKEMFPLKVWADCRQCPKINACDEIAVVKEVM